MTDLSVRLLREGYRAIESDRRRRGGGATYASRLMGRRAVVLSGEAGARLFYDEDVVQRRGAVPPPLAWLLFGRGAVHGLDGAEHRTRKELFLGRLSAGQVASCATLARLRLRTAIEGWPGRRVDVHDELVRAYGGAVLTWVGAELPDDELARLSRAYARIVDGFGFAGRAYPRAWAARRATDRWARSLVRSVRDGRTPAAEGTVLAAIAANNPDERVAAVELGNVVRPTIAVSWMGTYAVLALAELPDQDAAPEVLTGEEARAARTALAQEVRRTTPFVPGLAGRARRGAEHDGVAIHPGDFLVLDVRGINLDPDLYPEPHAFRPARFLDRAPTAYDLVPQGGGPIEGHRCPGESMALQLLDVTIEVLAGQELAVESPVATDLSRMPTLPGGGLAVSVR
jgi:fatty-acid peroxygenase